MKPYFDVQDIADSYLDQINDCGQRNLEPKCFGSYRGPIMTNAVFGEWQEILVPDWLIT